MSSMLLSTLLAEISDDGVRGGTFLRGGTFNVVSIVSGGGTLEGIGNDATEWVSGWVSGLVGERERQVGHRLASSQFAPRLQAHTVVSAVTRGRLCDR